MNMPSLLEQSAVTIDVPDELGGAPGQWQSLPYKNDHQLASEWCWIALSTNIWNYYNAIAAMQQCTLANALLSQTGCCQSPGSSGCNKPGRLDLALTRTGNLQPLDDGEPFFSGAIDLASVEKQ